MGKANHYVGQRIQFFRKLKGFTQQQLADAIGKSKATVSKYEKGEISIDVETLNDISQVLGISLAQLTNYTEPGVCHGGYHLSVSVRRQPHAHARKRAAHSARQRTKPGRAVHGCGYR